MKRYNRIFMIVTDSLGIGADKKAKEFGDKGANTLYHVSQTGLLNIPTWKKLGIDSIAKIDGYNKIKGQLAYTAVVEEISNAKDTLAGHWEMMGVETSTPFPTFTENGFPPELISELEKAIGRKVIGNKSASGTDIIDELSHEELENNKIIVYTSEDSVLQICAHENKTGLKSLYKWGEAARKICSSKPEWNVGRIIVRPYIEDENGKWIRTVNRKDYSVMPNIKTTLEKIEESGVEVIAVGKINDIFSGKGINKVLKGDGDDENMDITIDIAVTESKNQFVFVNLVDFDSKYGHRRKPEGYAENINRLDIKLAKLINAMKDDDLLIMTSDHGNDPTFPLYNHTREYLPATIYAKNFEGKPKALKNFRSLATVGNIVAKNFGVELSPIGEDRSEEII